MGLNRTLSKREPRRGLRPRNCLLIATALLGAYAVGLSFTHRSHLSVCPARLEAAGVHFTEQESSAVPLENHERQRVYDSIQQDLRASGLSLDGIITQGLTMSDIFQVQHGEVVPQLLALEVPVRAVVAPITDQVATHRLSDVFMKHVASLVPTTGVWPQNSNLYHATVWHASTHQAPVRVTRAQLDAEVAAVTNALGDVCPLHLTLERVVVSRGGVVMACWQVSRGITTKSLRDAIQAALPSAPTPDKQAVQDKAVWYTTIGRLLVDPSVGSFARLWGATATTVLDGVAQQMTEELCGLQTQVDRVWFIQEFERLALALSGRWSMDEILLSDQECI